MSKEKASEVPALFIIGTAGSGKTSLTSSIVDWLIRRGIDAEAVNLDPGVEFLPYDPIVDVREFIDIGEIMRVHGLGPNSALIFSIDLMIDYIDEMKKILNESNADIFIVDTPGQIELFAFRVSGSIITKELFWGSKAIAYLIDIPFSLDPLNFVSNIFLEMAVFSRFLLPTIPVLTKADLVDSESIKKILSWFSNKESLLDEARKNYGAEKFLYVKNMIRAMEPVSSYFQQPVVVSSFNLKGMVELYASISRIFFRGEETMYGPPP